MLRISYSHTKGRQQWTLCGQLAGPWVQELLAVWRNSRQTAREPRAVVDLRDVTFIDESGEALLSDMRRDGVEFVTAGIANRYLVQNLKRPGARSMRRRFAH